MNLISLKPGSTKFVGCKRILAPAKLKASIFARSRWGDKRFAYRLSKKIFFPCEVLIIFVSGGCSKALAMPFVQFISCITSCVMSKNRSLRAYLKKTKQHKAMTWILHQSTAKLRHLSWAPWSPNFWMNGKKLEVFVCCHLRLLAQSFQCREMHRHLQ